MLTTLNIQQRGFQGDGMQLVSITREYIQGNTKTTNYIFPLNNTSIDCDTKKGNDQY